MRLPTLLTQEHAAVQAPLEICCAGSSGNVMVRTPGQYLQTHHPTHPPTHPPLPTRDLIAAANTADHALMTRAAMSTMDMRITSTSPDLPVHLVLPARTVPQARTVPRAQQARKVTWVLPALRAMTV